MARWWPSPSSARSRCGRWRGRSGIKNPCPGNGAGTLGLPPSRPFRPPGRAAMRIVEMYEMLEHLRERAALACLQRSQDQPLRRLHRGFDVANKPPPRWRNVERLGAPVMRTIDAGNELLALQAADHIADRGAVEGDEVAQCGLIDPRMAVDRNKRGILHRRHVKSLGLVEEQRKGNLVQPANEMARHLDEAAVADRLRHAGFPARAACEHSSCTDITEPVDRRAA